LRECRSGRERGRGGPDDETTAVHVLPFRSGFPRQLPRSTRVFAHVWFDLGVGNASVKGATLNRIVVVARSQLRRLASKKRNVEVRRGCGTLPSRAAFPGLTFMARQKWRPVLYDCVGWQRMKGWRANEGRGQICCTRGSKRPTAYPERGGVVLIHPRDLCIQQYLGKWRVLSLRVRQVPAPCQKVEDENLKNLVLQLREHQSK